MAFLNPELLMNGTVALDTATPLENYQTMRIRQQSADLANAKGQADLAQSRFNDLNDAYSGVAGNPTVENARRTVMDLGRVGRLSADRVQDELDHLPTRDEDVRAWAQTAALRGMRGGGQLAATEPSSQMLNLGNRFAQIKTDKLSGDQQVGAQYRINPTPTSRIGLPGGDQLIADSERADPHIYGGSDAQPDQTAPNLAGARTPWNAATLGMQGGGGQSAQVGAGGDPQAAAPVMSLADLMATAQASGHPPQHVMRLAKAKGWRVVR